MNLGIKCDRCKQDILKTYGVSYFVLINEEIEVLCQGCFELKYSRFSNKKCEVCGEKDKQNYPYFLKKDGNLSLVCKECYNRVYGDDKK